VVLNAAAAAAQSAKENNRS